MCFPGDGVSPDTQPSPPTAISKGSTAQAPVGTEAPMEISAPLPRSEQPVPDSAGSDCPPDTPRPLTRNRAQRGAAGPRPTADPANGKIEITD